MAEMTSVKGISFADYEEYQMWVEYGRPSDWLCARNTGHIANIEKHLKKLVRKWGK